MASSCPLLESEMPCHSHAVRAKSDLADVQSPSPARSLARSHSASAYQATTNQALVFLAPEALAPAGGDQPHNNLQPYLFTSASRSRGYFRREGRTALGDHQGLLLDTWRFSNTVRVPDASPLPHQLIPPLAGGGRGWGLSVHSSERLDPHPTLPPSRGKESKRA